MADQTGAPQQDKPKSSVKPARKPEKRKQLVSIRHGAADVEPAEDRAKGSGLFDQRPAVRRVPAATVSAALAQPQGSVESRFAHDFSAVPARSPVVERAAGNETLGRQLAKRAGGTPLMAYREGSVVQCKLVVGTKEYSEYDHQAPFPGGLDPIVYHDLPFGIT